MFLGSTTGLTTTTTWTTTTTTPMTTTTTIILGCDSIDINLVKLYFWCSWQKLYNIPTSLEDAVLAGKCNKKPDQSVTETLSVQSVSICENYYKDFCFTAGIFGKAGQFIIVYTLETRIGSLTQG